VTPERLGKLKQSSEYLQISVLNRSVVSVIYLCAFLAQI